MVANQKNFVTGLMYLVIGVGVAAIAQGYGIGTPYRMGPGFFPFSVACALATIGACILVSAILPSARRETIGSWPIKSLVVVLGSVVLFGLLLEPLGLLIAVPVMLAVSALAHPQFTWRSLLLLIAILLPFTYVVFVLLLGLQFPLLPTFLIQ